MFPTQFTGASFTWEQVKLEKIATFSKGKGYSKLDLKRKGYPIFLYGQMYTNYRYKIVETSTYAILKEDAVVSNGNEIVIPSSGETSVDIARASWIAQKGIIIGSDLNIIRPTSSVHPLFLALSLSNNQVKYNLAKVAQGNSIVHLYNNNLKKVNIYFPNIVEQNKIGNILNSISNCINLHERKCEELALIKKALLQKLFPKKDEIKPEVRYKNFSDAWEQRKLGGVAKFYSGGTPSVGVSDYYDGTIPFIRSAEINSTSTELYLSELGLQNSSAKMVHRGDILYALYGATSGEVGISKINGAINQAILAIIPHKGYNSEFLEQWLRKNKEAIIKTYLQGGQGNLSGAIVKQIEVSFPSFDEQQKIGKSFQKIDSLITLHQRKLEKLKQLKKFLLQNMFI